MSQAQAQSQGESALLRKPCMLYGGFIHQYIF
jgi:hypothetical protein